MTYINCILKLTVLPTEAIAEVPGVGKGLSAFKCKSSMHGAESLFVVSQGKAVIQAMLQPCAHSDSSLQKAICPPESPVLWAQSYQSNLPDPSLPYEAEQLN